MLLLFPALIFAQKSRFINYSVDDGLAQAYVYNFTQDKEGNLWIGTGNGLSRFDGYNFKNFTEQDSLGGNFITCGLKTEEGLWFGHFNGNLSYYENGIFKPIQNAKKGIGSVVDIQQDFNGNVWFANQNDGFKKLNLKMKSSKTFKSLFHQPIYTFIFTSKEQMLVGTSEGLKLCELNKNEQVEEKYNFTELGGNKIVDIIKSSKLNVYYILTEDEGVFSLELDNEGHNLELLTKSTNCSRAQNIFEDSNDNLWVSCLASGLFKLSLSENGSLQSIKNYGEDNGLQTDAIKAVFEDREGNIWVGKYGGGLSRLVPSSNSFINFNSKYYSNDIYSICINQNFKWIGTSKELLKCDLAINKVLASYDINGKLPNDKITALCDRNNTELWIGTEKSGVYRLNYRTGKIQSQFLRLGNLEKSISSIVSDHEHVWIGTQKGVCRFNPDTEDKKWYTLREEGLPHNSVNHLFKDKENKIWVGTLSNTLSYIENSVLTNLNLSSGSNLLNISSIIEDNNGAIWIGTQGSGVYVINHDSTLNVNFQHGLLSDYCYSLNIDKDNIWVTHRGGISQIRVSDYHIKTIQKNAGIHQSVEFNRNSTVSNENILWFGSNKGIYQYDISKEVQHLVSPTLKIGSIKINGEEYSSEKKLVLPSGHYKIELGFKGISLNEPELIKYKYKLEGYDHDWSRFENQRKAEYKQLGSGDYIFNLKALTANGIESKEPLQFKIKIRYPLWQKTWFQIVALICLIFAIYLFIVLREKNLKRIQRNLIQNLDDKTREVIAKEEVIKERKRTEQELIVAKEKAEESDRLKTAFLSNMSHEIRTPLNAIVGFSTMLQEPNVNPSSKGRYMSILKSNTNDLLSLIDDIMDISSIEAGQLKLKFQDCEVDKILSELNDVHNKKLIDLKSEDLELVCVSNATNITIQSDPLRLKQILSNLIGNAIKFTEKGTIEFGYEMTSPDKIKFFVRDTGIGINADQIEVIFERFRKEYRNGWNKLYRGAGLGLAISKSMVHLLGGEIGVESLQGVGSYFYFTLPIKSK